MYRTLIEGYLRACSQIHVVFVVARWLDRHCFEDRRKIYELLVRILINKGTRRRLMWWSCGVVNLLMQSKKGLLMRSKVGQHLLLLLTESKQKLQRLLERLDNSIQRPLITFEGQDKLLMISANNSGLCNKYEYNKRRS